MTAWISVEKHGPPVVCKLCGYKYTACTPSGGDTPTQGDGCAAYSYTCPVTKRTLVVGCYGSNKFDLDIMVWTDGTPGLDPLCDDCLTKLQDNGLLTDSIGQAEP